jgi:hypothetical protein
MKSERSPDSSTFDSLWDSDEDVDAATGAGNDDDDLPPALAPSRQGKVLAEKRITLTPPMPSDEYVQTMMELGELDDPMGIPYAALREGGSRLQGPGKPLGLVLASENEFEPWRDEPPPTERGLSAPVHESSYTRPLGGPARSHLPIPRAPSVPPPLVDPDMDALDALDALEGLGSLDALDAFDASPFEEIVPEPRHFVKGSSGRPPASIPGPLSPPRTLSSPTPASRPPISVGLRLRDRTPSHPPPEDDPPGDRITPVSTRSGGPAPASEPAPSSFGDCAEEMQILFEARNYSSALVLAETVLVSDPGHATARRCAESCRDMLGQKYLSRLGGRDNVPRVIMTPEELRFLSLDHRAGFLLSFVDGSMSLDEVLDVSSMPELDALRILFELRMQGVIEIVEPSRRPGRR